LEGGGTAEEGTKDDDEWDGREDKGTVEGKAIVYGLYLIYPSILAVANSASFAQMSASSIGQWQWHRLGGTSTGVQICR
jgi:hypothetical protein